MSSDGKNDRSSNNKGAFASNTTNANDALPNAFNGNTDGTINSKIFSSSLSNLPSDSSSSSNALAQQQQPQFSQQRFEIKKWNAVAMWSWDIQVDNCAICRNHIMDLCIECQSAPTANCTALATATLAAATATAAVATNNSSSSSNPEETEDNFSNSAPAHSSPVGTVNRVVGGENDPANSVDGLNSGSVSNECVVAWGKCNHAFHHHCISRWLRTRNVCPLDNNKWEYQHVENNINK